MENTFPAGTLHEVNVSAGLTRDTGVFYTIGSEQLLQAQRFSL